MSLDIKYRPRTYNDVLGQEPTIKILRSFVREGRGFQQSYLFCGAHGSGKTTLGRILARALLCENPQQGDPCGSCTSCRGLLENGTSADFVEVDAATNSGKGDVKKITDEIQYATFSGKRRIYLFDEAHQLSKEALDALLKPLEDNLPGSEDKQLVCIFCTTEPERMRATVLSRCAPAFVIRPQTPAVIADRLAYICEQEGIEADHEMLALIAEITECHIRDALKAIEGVSMLGPLDKANVSAYLHLDTNAAYIDLLDALGSDMAAAFAAVDQITQRSSPVTCYEKLADVAMLAFRTTLGESVPAYWSKERLEALGRAKGAALLGYASRFASRPGRPTKAMLQMDIAHLHHMGGSVTSPTAVLEVRGGPAPKAAPRTASAPQRVVEDPADTVSPVQPQVGQDATEAPGSPSPILTAEPAAAGTQMEEKPDASGTIPDQDALWVEAQSGKAASRKMTSGSPRKPKQTALMSHDEFSTMLGKTLVELSGAGPP